MIGFKVIRRLPKNLVRFKGKVRGGSLFAANVLKDVGLKFADFFRNASVTRHKTAKRLGATPTGILEFTKSFPSRSRGGGEINGRSVGGQPQIEITGVPFLRRAYGAVTVRPKRASCLTIPIHKDAYGRTARQTETLGYVLFTARSRRGKGILFGKTGDGKVVPLFALVKNATIPKDAGLMPTNGQIAHWTAESAKRNIGL